MLRQKEKRKDVSVLPDASTLIAQIEAARPMIQDISREIKESDIRLVLPFHPGYSRDLTMARRYELYKEGEKGPEVEFVQLFDELTSNYAEALARFRALNWFPDEDMVFVASRETNDVGPPFDIVETITLTLLIADCSLPPLFAAPTRQQGRPRRPRRAAQPRDPSSIILRMVPRLQARHR